VEAIVAHELAHLETNDGLVLAMADGIGRAVVGFTTVLALPALLALSGFAAASAWIRGRPGDRSGPFAWLHRARWRTGCSAGSCSRRCSPGRAVAQAGVRGRRPRGRGDRRPHRASRGRSGGSRAAGAVVAIRAAVDI